MPVVPEMLCPRDIEPIIEVLGMSGLVGSQPPLQPCAGLQLPTLFCIPDTIWITPESVSLVASAQFAVKLSSTENVFNWFGVTRHPQHSPIS